MSFLAPWSAIWAGAVALPLLVLFYVLRLRRRAVRVSSTVLWEEAVKDLHANEPFRRFRWSLLFLLQLLVLAMLLLAIARPVVPGTSPTADRIVIVLDRSASMRAVDGAAGPTDLGRQESPPTRWDAALASARGLLDELSRASGPRGHRPEVMVVVAAATVEPITDFTSNFADLRTAIDSLEPTDQPLNERLLAEFLSALPPVEEDIDEVTPTWEAWRIGVVIISDGGFDGDELARVPGEVAISFRSIAPRALPSSSVASSAAQRDPILADNVGIVAISARRVIEDPTRVRVFARLVNAHAQPVAAPVVCVVDGTPRDSTTVQIPAAIIESDARGERPGVTLGQASTSFELLLTGGGVVTLNVLRPDALESDNSASVLIEPLRRPRTLIVAPTVDDKPLADGFLLSALEAAEISALRVVTLPDYERWGGGSRLSSPSLDTSGVRTMMLNEFDLVVFDRVEPARPPNRPLLRFAATPAAPEIESQPAAEPRPMRRWRFVLWNRSHPVMRDVALDDVLLVTPARDQGRSITDLDGDRRTTPLALAQADIRRAGTDGGGQTQAGATPLILAVERTAAAQGPPRAIDVGFDPTASNWGPSESFPIFIANAVDWLTGSDDARWGLSGRLTTTAEPLIVRPTSPPLSNFSGQPTEGLIVAMEGPSGPSRARVTIAGEATLPPPTRVGLHTLTVLNADSAERAVAGAGGAVGWMPVNLLAPDESSLLLRTNTPWAVSAPSAAGLDATGLNAGRTARTSHGREVWHFFAVAALAILAVEWLVFARLSRA